MKKIQLISFLIILQLIFFSALAQNQNGMNYNSFSEGYYSNLIQSTNEVKDYKVSLMFDPVGFLSFGPSINIEPALASNFSINTGVRFQNMGLLLSLYYPDLKLSYTFHAGFRFYFKPKEKIDGFFLSPGFELGRSNYKSGNIYSVRAFGGELGYKWVFKNRFSLEISDNVGIIQSKHIYDPDYEVTSSEWITDMFVFYMLSVKLGVSF